MKNKLAKLLALLLPAALLTACMAGCTGKTEQPAKAEATEKAEPAKDSTPADEEITLTFWHTYGDAEEAQFKDVVPDQQPQAGADDLPRRLLSAGHHLVGHRQSGVPVYVQ